MAAISGSIASCWWKRWTGCCTSKHHALESKPEILTEREWEVVRWVGQGMTNKEIARLLTISDTTVKSHLQRIFSKLKVGRRWQTRNHQCRSVRFFEQM